MLKLRRSRRRSRTSSLRGSCASVLRWARSSGSCRPSSGSIATARGILRGLPRDVAGAERWARRHDARTTGRAALTAAGARMPASATRSRSAINPGSTTRRSPSCGSSTWRWSPPTRRGGIRSASSGPRRSPTSGCTARRSFMRASTGRRARAVGEAHRRLGAGRGGRLRLFRQRCPRPRPARCHALAGDAGPAGRARGGAARRRGPERQGGGRCPRRLIRGACACPRLRPRRDTRST